VTARRRFYGWPLVSIGFLLYGLGIAPAYYSWGFIAPAMIDDIDLTREQIGGIFGAFTLTFSLVGPLAAWSIRRVGLRVTITAGALIAALGFGLVSVAESVAGLYLSFAVLGGVGIGLSTGMPTQILAVYWFRRYRARAIAIMWVGAAIVGALVNPFDAWLLARWGWRTAWVVVASISVLVAAIGAVFVRERPEDLGQLPDGADPDRLGDGATPAANGAGSGASIRSARVAITTPAGRWTAAAALRTPQFLIATFAVLANAVSWRVLTAHGRLHFEDLGFTPTVAAAILGVRVGVSAFGRLSGSLGDLLAPTRVLATALTINGLGLAGLVFATTAPLAYLCVILIGVGYGAAYVNEPVVFAHFFGRAAFVGTAGVRVLIIGVAGWLAPAMAGAAADRTGSYQGPIFALAAMSWLGALAILVCRHPGAGRPSTELT